jgi:APA family basic amino acid/polyamine antiporter
VWIVAGLLSLAGALTYAELAAMLPRAGGEYVFIRQAYGSLLAFPRGGRGSSWQAPVPSRLSPPASPLSSTSSQAARFTHTGSRSTCSAITRWFTGQEGIAIAAVLLVTIVNCTTVAVSGRIAFILTVFKIALVLGIGVGAMLLANGSWAHFTLSNDSGVCEGVAAAARGGMAGFGAAMLGAMWAYNGWNEVTYIAEEVKHPQRNLPLALIGGIGVIASLYIFVNVAYFYVLTPTEVAAVPASSAVATEVITRVLGAGAATLMAGVLAMSIFGALQIATLVCARVPYAMARDGMFFSALARVSPDSRSWRWACRSIRTGRAPRSPDNLSRSG